MIVAVVALAPISAKSLRIEFLVSWLDPSATIEEPTGTKRPACRVALTPTGALDLINRCQQILDVLQKNGVLKKRSKSTAPMVKTN